MRDEEEPVRQARLPHRHPVISDAGPAKLAVAAAPAMTGFGPREGFVVIDSAEKRNAAGCGGEARLPGGRRRHSRVDEITDSLSIADLLAGSMSTPPVAPTAPRSAQRLPDTAL